MQAQPAAASCHKEDAGPKSEGMEMTSKNHAPSTSEDVLRQKYETLNMDFGDLVGLKTQVPDRKKRLACLDWILAATRAHERKYGRMVDHEEHGVDYWKEVRRSQCRNFFLATMLGLCLAIWANEIIHHHGHKDSFQSLSLQITMVVSTCVAVKFLCDFYHAELCIARLKGWKLAPGFCPRALKGANLWSQFLRDLLILIPQPLPFLFFEFTVHDAGMERDSTYPVSVVLLSLMFLRVYFVPRFHSFCIVDMYTNRHDVLFSLNKTILDDSLLLKSAMSTSLSAVLGMFALQIVLYSYMMMMFERATAEGPLQNWSNSIWLIIVTMTTVGYGDVYPTTRLGRLVALSASFSAMIMIAICINIAQSMLTLSRTDQKVVKKAFSRISLREKHLAAGRLITATFRLNLERVKEAAKPPQQEPSTYEELAVQYPPPFEGMPDGGDDGPLGKNIEKDVELEGVAGTLQEWGIIPKKPITIGPLQKEQELPGGGRGRPKTTILYGQQMSLDVLLAENLWHLALRDFKLKRRSMYHFDMAESTDVTTQLHEIEARIYESDCLLDESEMKVSEAHRMLKELVEQAEAAASAAR